MKFYFLMRVYKIITCLSGQGNKLDPKENNKMI